MHCWVCLVLMSVSNFTTCLQWFLVIVITPISRKSFSPLISCKSLRIIRGRVQLKCDGTRWRTGREAKWKLANGVGSQYSTHYLGTSALLPLMRTPRLPVFKWTDAPADLNGLGRVAKRRNLVSARVPSHFKRSLPRPPYQVQSCDAGVAFDVVTSIAHSVKIGQRAQKLTHAHMHTEHGAVRILYFPFKKRSKLQKIRTFQMLLIPCDSWLRCESGDWFLGHLTPLFHLHKFHSFE
jgi:hypothetical protein